MKTELIPVIHMVNQNQVLTNVRTCVESGVEKIFLINHQTNKDELIKCATIVKELYPNLWIGLNMLDVYLEDAILYDFDFDGLWCDQTLTIDESKNRKFKGMLFTGLSFKYQPQPKDLEIACEEAILATDVATTSGAVTGRAADINKIKNIHEYLNGHPMAIASGVNRDNILTYKGLVNYLLVASSITSRSEIINKEDLDELLNLLK